MKTIKERADEWAVNGELSYSSVVLFNYFTNNTDIRGLKSNHVHSFPNEPADYDKCYLLLKLIPEWRERILEVKEISSYWKEYAINWEKIEKLYLNAVSDGYFKLNEYNEFADYLKELQNTAHQNEIRSVGGS